uniref:Uncharacterized protein n=1 Tax=Kalanchoe fedtschenkoi TaxID=63787 RepID=A0A7N0UI25_KALFE
MVFGPLRAALRPFARTLVSGTPPFSSKAPPLTFPKSDLSSSFGSLHLRSPWTPPTSAIHSLTDTRLPKRRPTLVAKPKRARLRPKGPIAWVQHVPGEPIPASQPNKGSLKERNEKKRRKLKHDFIVAERKKRKAEIQAAKRKKLEQRVERKMAAVARDRAWAQRLAELQKMEEEKKKSMT